MAIQKDKLINADKSRTNQFYLDGHYYQYDLGWIVDTIMEVIDKINNLYEDEIVHYADPIHWDITAQYTKNTVVVDPQTGDAYISKQPVPQNVLLTNTDYWLPIFNYEGQFTQLKKQIGAVFEQDVTTREVKKGELVWYGNSLCRAAVDMPESTKIDPLVNVKNLTVSEAILCRIGAVLEDTGGTLKRTADNIIDSVTGDYTVNSGHYASTAASHVFHSTGDTEIDSTGKTILNNILYKTDVRPVTRYFSSVPLYTEDGEQLSWAVLTEAGHLSENYVCVDDFIDDPTTPNWKTVIENAISSNVVLYFPSRIYAITEQVIIDKPCRLVGAPGAVIRTSGDGQFFIKHHTLNVTIENLSFLHAGSNVGLDVVGINTHIHNCVFTNTGTGIPLAVRNHDNTVSECYFDQQTSGVGTVYFRNLDGDDGVNWSINNMFIGNVIHTVGAGILIGKEGDAHLQEGLTIANNIILGDANTTTPKSSFGLLIDGVFRCNISGNIIDQFKDYAVYLRGSKDMVKGVDINHNYIMGLSWCVFSDNTTAGRVTCFSIAHNNMWHNGIALTIGCSLFTIDDNALLNCDTAFNFNNVQNVVVCNCSVQNTTDFAILNLTDATKRVFMRDNFVRKNAINGTFTKDVVTLKNNPDTNVVSEVHTSNWNLVEENTYTF